jgi:hypothetical protein
MNNVAPWIETAGKFAVEHVPCPHFSQAVSLAGPRTGVIHTIEGSLASGMGVFKRHFAPHFAVGPGKIIQMVQVGTIGAALVTHNWVPIVQIEVEGSSKEEPWIFPDDVLEPLRALLAVCQREYGIPLFHPWADGDYGRAGNNPHRGAGKWGVVAGWYGHADAPLPDTHWDPGNLKWSELLEGAGKLTDILHAPGWTPPAPEPRHCGGAAAPAVASMAGFPTPWQGDNGLAL